MIQMYPKRHLSETQIGQWLHGTRLPHVRLLLLLLVMFCAAASLPAQNVSFSSSGLQGESLNNPTSLQFGPDGRLYVSQQNGTIYAYQIQRNGPNDYQVTSTEEINLIKNIQNHNDDGTLSGTGNRQITGIYLTGTGANPKLFVSSSDPRIGAGGGGNDIGLDTNSGVVSCLECTGGIDANGECTQWTKVDYVRGLPRSEENHSVNGMQYDETENILYLAVGGHTNAGSPSNNFAFTVEYTFAACVVSIDLDVIEQLPTLTDDAGEIYKYDLPTLDDPTRNNVFSNGSPASEDPNDANYSPIDVGDPWGGNDGLNMAKYDPNGPVQIHAFGFRNLYDIVITENGRMYGVDNGANGNWGGHPDGESDYPSEMGTGQNGGAPYVSTSTNNYLNGEPGSTGIGPGGDSQVNNKNGLHYIRPLEPGDFNYVGDDPQNPGKYYGGHPNPIWGNPAGAGIYTKGAHTVDPIEGDDDYWRTQKLSPSDQNFSTSSLPVDWPPVPVDDAWAAVGDFRNSGQDDNSLANYGPSTNGIAEYTASNFNGALTGNLLLAAFNGNIYEVELSADGKVALNCPTVPQNGSSTVSNCNASFASGFGSTPLDVIAQGDNDPFGGTVWAATYGSDNITIFEPADYNGSDPIACEGTDDDTIDEDGDLYTNADEIANGTNPCSGASKPNDADNALEFGPNNEFKRSDLNDPDDDNDGIADIDDPFQLDPMNGKGAIGQLPIRLELFNETGYGFGGIGFTGLMTNGDDYFDLIDDSGDELVYGGTAGIYTDPSITDGDAFTNNNTQKNGFQFAVDVSTSTGPFTIEAPINGPYFNNDNTPDNFASQGIFLGTGDQDNYLKVVLTGNVIGQNAGFQVLYEDGGTQTSDQAVGVANILDATQIRLFLKVDPVAGTVQAQYSADQGPITNIGTAVTVSGDLLAAIQGTYTINGTPSCLAVGTIATSFGGAAEFGGSWDYFRIAQDPSSAQAFVTVNTNGLNGSTFGNSSFQITNNSSEGQEITNVTFDLSSAIIKEVVFDPDGNAGDATAKGFTPNNGTQSTTGVTAHSFSDAYEGGFYGLSIDFNDFNPNETLEFGLDIDPVSIKGGSAPGPNESGSVSGLELTGAVVTVTYAGGETQEVDLFRSAGDNSDSENIVRTQLPPEPAISMLGVDNMSTVFQDEQMIRVEVGFEEVEVRLLQLEAGLFVEDLNGPFAGTGYSIDPFEVNSVVAINEFSGTTGTDGSVDFDVTLTDSDAEAGYNLFAAVVEDPDGATGKMSNVIIVEYDPDAQPTTLYRINTVQETIPATDGGIDWEGAGGTGPQSGNGWTVNTGNISTHNISGRDASVPNYVPQSLFAKERWDPPAAPNMTWNFDVNNGMYQVRLYMGNGFGGTSAPGTRVFGISIEGETVETGLDLSATFGHQVGGMKEYIVDVTDGDLEIEFLGEVENPTVNGIEILAFGGDEDPNAITVSPIENQNNEEGDEVSGLFVAASGGDGNLQYSASGLPDGVDIEPTNGQIFGTLASGTASNSPYMVTVTVDDSDQDNSDATSVMFTWTVDEPLPLPGPGQVLYRVNAGGPEVAAGDASTPAWGQDQGNIDAAGNSPYLSMVSTGTSTYAQTAMSAYKGAVVRDASIPAAAPDALFTTERFDMPSTPALKYSFPVEAGTMVEVDLYFAELFGNIDAAGQRTFDVTIEGQTVLMDFDQFAEAGALGAIRETFSATVDQDGLLDIEFIHGIENPAIKAIEVRSASSEAPVISPIADVSFGVLGIFEAGRFIVDAVDQQDDNFSLTAEGLPEGLTLVGNEITGTIAAEALTGGPNNDGVHPVTITALDVMGNSSTETFNFTVTDRTLTILSPEEGATVSSNGFTVDWTSTGGATDVFEHVHVILVGGIYTDDGVTRLGSQPLMGSVDFPNNTYSDLQPGDYQLILKFAYPSHVEFDESVVIPDTVNFTIEDSDNVAPVVTNPGNQVGTEGAMVNLPIQATDIDDCGSLSYSATGLPPSLEIDAQTGVISGTIDAGTESTSGGAWIEQNGLLVIEMESADNLPGSWETADTYSTTFSPNVNNPTDATGDDFIIWQAGQNLGNPGNGLVTYPIQINTPGVYQFKWRNQVGNGTETTEHNDTWLKIDADQFYGSKNGGASTVCPNGAPTGTCPAGSEGPEGSSSNGWFKIYSSGANNWSWSTNTSDNDAHQIFAEFDEPGEYTIQISARSSSHAVDRMVLVNQGVAGNNGQGLGLPESPRAQSQPGTVGAAANNPYNVTVTVTDDCDPPLQSTIDFDWTILQPDMLPSANIKVNPNGGLGSSTFGNNSFQITNTGTADIVKVTIDASTTFMPDIVFDPVGKAGDNGAKCLTTGNGGNTATQVGLTVPGNGGSDAADCESVFQQPHNGIDDEEGYDIIELEFTDFNPDEAYYFGVDMDPTSIKGDLSTGDAGAISGFECIGAMVTIEFSDGTVLSTSLFDEGSLGGSDADLTVSNPEPAPSIEVKDIPATPALTNEQNQTIVVNGAPGQQITLLQIDARLYIDPGNPTIGFDVDPFEANEAVAKAIYTVTIGANGMAEIPVTLLLTAGGGNTPDAGLNHFIAVAGAANGPNSKASNTIVLEYDPNAVLETSLDLSVQLQGRDALLGENPDVPDYSGAYAIELYQNNVLVEDLTELATTDGEITLTELTVGTYTVYIKHPQYLSAVETITLQEGSNTLDMGMLLGGDANNDNIISVTDFSILAGQFGATGADLTSDFNGNGGVSIADFSILSGNFNSSGELPGAEGGNAMTNVVLDDPQPVDMELRSPQKRYQDSDLIPVQLVLDADQQGIQGIAATLDYDPAVLSLDRIEWTDVFGIVLQEQVSVSEGRINLATGDLFTEVKGTQMVATLYFRANRSAQTSIRFAANAEQAAAYAGMDLLNQTTDVEVIVESLLTDTDDLLPGTPSVRLYPIPSQGLINLEVANMDFTAAYSMKIFGPNGQLILTRDFRGDMSQQLDLSQQPKGLYNLQLITEDEVITRIFSIQ